MANTVQYTGGSSFLHYMSGALLAFVSATSVLVGLGQFQNETSTALITIRSAITLNLATVGPAGLDAGVLAIDTFYYVYAIMGRDVGVSAIASTSASAPVLPAGYTSFRRLDSFRTAHAAATVLPFFKTGAGRTRRTDFLYYEAASMVLLSGGNAVVETNIACASMLPANARTLIAALTMLQTDPLSISTAQVGRPGDATFSPIVIGSPPGLAEIGALQVQFATDSQQRLAYLVNGGGGGAPTLNLIATGYEETI